MSGVDPTTPNRLKMAEDRLAQAIGRLQAAVDNRDATTPASPDDEVLRFQLKDLQAENDQLRELVDDTAARLDGTIAKFKIKLTHSNQAGQD